MIRLSELCAAMSHERLGAYSLDTDLDSTDALARYLWNGALCIAFHPSLHVLEVALRNNLFRASQRHVNTAGRTIGPFGCGLARSQRSSLRESRHKWTKPSNVSSGIHAFRRKGGLLPSWASVSGQPSVEPPTIIRALTARSSGRRSSRACSRTCHEPGVRVKMCKLAWMGFGSSAIGSPTMNRYGTATFSSTTTRFWTRYHGCIPTCRRQYESVTIWSSPSAEVRSNTARWPRDCWRLLNLSCYPNAPAPPSWRSPLVVPNLTTATSPPPAARAPSSAATRC